MSNNRMAMMKDTSACVACYACRVACQNQNGLPEDQTYLSLAFTEKGTFPNVKQHLARKSCMHCVEAACATACPIGILHHTEQGLVNFVDGSNEGCLGCGLCETACPIDGALEMRDNKAYKCTGCEELVAEGLEPACVDTCIAAALHFGPVEEMLDLANERLARVESQNPDANLFGADSQGASMGVVSILRSSPAEFELLK